MITFYTRVLEENSKPNPKHSAKAACSWAEGSERINPDTGCWAVERNHPSAVFAIQRGRTKFGLAPSVDVYAVKWGSQQADRRTSKVLFPAWFSLECGDASGVRGEQKVQVDGRS